MTNKHAHTPFRYFTDTENGTIEFNKADYRKDGMYGFDNISEQWLKITRKVKYRANPSKHKCDDRCVHATGKVMSCECSCGGENHGRGY